MHRAALLLLLPVLFAGASGQPSPSPLQIYVVDVEGGKATLIVAPSGESMLVDTGNVGDGARRDAERILAAIGDARVRQIDYLVITHWHRDHFGGLSELADRIPIRAFIDHGANVQPAPEADSFLRDTYPRLHENKRHAVVKPGDLIPIAGLDVRVVSSAGATIAKPLPGGGAPNPYCSATRPDADPGENRQAIGLRIDHGYFRLVDLADLSTDQEFDLMCPNNPLGRADVFMVSHHAQPRSNHPMLVHAIEPRVAIANNGPRKGGQPEVMRAIYTAPGLETLWQLHTSTLSGPEYTAPGLFVANLEDQPHDGPAHWIKVVARMDGSFTVANSRNGFSKIYPARGNGF
jgi:beta-lactamase superfamily II metal-dependent hydrolase